MRDSLTEKGFAQVDKNIADALRNHCFFLRNFGDWNVEVFIPCSELKTWDDGSIIRHSTDEMLKLGEEKNEYYAKGFLSKVFSDDYIKGYAPSGCATYKLPHTPRLNAI